MSACVTISEKNIDTAIAIASRFQIAEVRLDLCDFDYEKIQLIFSSHSNLIATCRENHGANSARIERLKHAIALGAAYIDLEYEMETKDRMELVQLAKESRVKTIISHHNFEKTDSIEEFRKIIESSFDMGADYVKLATKVHTKEDSSRIVQLYGEYKNIIAFGLGEQAKFTRMTCLFLGAPFTYVYVGPESNQIAEGQLSEQEYNTIMAIFGEPSQGR
jgi:3-dehydroquinate dehydratase I